jgi:hypothetical protein
MTKKSGTTTDAVEIIHRRYFEGKPERLKILEEARADGRFSNCGPRPASLRVSSAS